MNITLLFKIYIEDVHKDTVHSVILKLYSGDASHMNCGFESGSVRPYWYNICCSINVLASIQPCWRTFQSHNSREIVSSDINMSAQQLYKHPLLSNLILHMIAKLISQGRQLTVNNEPYLHYKRQNTPIIGRNL